MKLLVDRAHGHADSARLRGRCGLVAGRRCPKTRSSPGAGSRPSNSGSRRTGWARISTSKGALTGALELECSRCLARYRHAASRAVPAGSGAGRRSGSRRSGGGAGAGARRDLPRRRARDGLVPGQRDRPRERSCAKSISLALPVQPLCERIAPDCVRTAARIELGAATCDCRRDRSPTRLRGARRVCETGSTRRDH